MKLNEWFFKNARAPLAIASALVLGLACVFLWNGFRSLRLNQHQAVSDVADLIALGLSQQNRVLVETVLDANRWGMGSTKAVLCTGGTPLISSGQDLGSLCDNIRAPLGTRSLEKGIPGFQDHRLVVIAPVLSDVSSFILVLCSTVGLLLFYLLIISRVQGRVNTDLLTPLNAGLSQDIPLAIEELEALRITQKDATETKVSAAVSEAIIKRNEQIAHDIRSPLAALGVLSSSSTILPEDERVMINAAVQRIRDIANQLTGPLLVESSRPPGSQTTPHLLSAVLERIVSEKRTQYRSNLDLQIDLDISDGYGLFSSIELTEFYRMLSNIVNNAIEALPGRGAVKIVLTHRVEKGVVIQISDSGKGIPASVLPKLMQRGETFGKKGGSGLGLYHAKTTLGTWNGDIKIRSQLGMGTTVEIGLPQADPPEWFLARLDIKVPSRVLILDDDASIHHIWKDRFRKILAEGGASPQDTSRIELIHTSTPEQFKAAMSTGDGADICLVDFELLGFKDTGLSLIRELGLRKHCCLVTSRYDDPAIIAECMDLGVKLIPKPSASQIPLELDLS
jgi:signal transduction histidine kinase